MAIAVVEHTFTGATTTSYDPMKTTLGSLMVQNTGATAKDKWVGPRPTIHTQLYDTVLANYLARPFVMEYDSDTDLFFIPFGSTGSSGVATPWVTLYEYKLSTHKFRFRGYITPSIPYAGTQGAYGVYAIAATRHLYTTGTVSASGTTVTGNGTSWNSALISVGARIGFGSTDPSQITQWTEISAIGGETTLTTLATLSLPGGTPYVIEEFRICLAMQNSTTATNAGLYLIKGLHPETFSPYGRVIPAATTVDKIRAVYWLAEAATTAMTLGYGVAISPAVSDTEQRCHFIGGTSTTLLQEYEFNIRASLSSISSGRTLSAYLFKTALLGALPAAVYAGLNEITTANHGPGAGEPNIYFAATSRIHRIPTKQLWDTSLSWIMDGFQEIPTGGTGNFIVSGGINSVCYSAMLDRFILSPVNAVSRGYITRYDTNGVVFDNWFGITWAQLDRANTWPDFTPTPLSYASVVRTTSKGLLYVVRTGASSTPNVMFAIPLVHWDYAASTGQRVISPAFSLTRFASFGNLYVNATTLLGSDKFGSVTDPYRVYARTSGIADNSGGWTLIADTGDLSVLNPVDTRWNDWPTQVQFMFEFKTPYWTCIGARIHSLSFTYNQLSTDNHFKASVLSNNISFCWKFVQPFGESVPHLRVILFDENNTVLEDDNTECPRGAFQKSIDNGRTWATWDNGDMTNDETFVRYTPNSLSSGKRVRMVLTTR